MVREMLTRGEFNAMSQARQPDGSVLVTLTRRGDPHRYILHVRNLYRPDEEIIEERVEDIPAPGGS